MRDITVCVSADGKLEVPAEIQTQLQPGDRYQVIVTGDKIVFEKVKAGFDWEEWRRCRDSLPPDPNRMTMEEICEEFWDRYFPENSRDLDNFSQFIGGKPLPYKENMWLRRK